MLRELRNVHANGPFQPDRVLALFLAMAAEVPPPIVAFVTARLRGLDNGSGQSKIPA